MSQEDLKIVIALARTYNQLFGQIEQHLRRFKLTTSEFGVLEFLYHKGEQPTQVIAEKILVTSGTVTYIIDKLSRKALVARRGCEEDKRVTYVSLTEAGWQLIDSVFKEHENFLDDLLGSFETTKKEELITLLIELQQYMKGASNA